MRRSDDQRPEPDNDLEAVEQLLRARYGELSARVRRFVTGQPVFAVERASGDPWVVRVGHRLDHCAAALDVLRRVGYPAARVVPDSTGASVGPFDETHDDGPRSALVVTQVPGRPTPFEPSTLASVG